MSEYEKEDLILADITNLNIFTKPQAVKLEKLVTFLYENKFIYEHQFKSLMIYIDVILDAHKKNEIEIVRNKKDRIVFHSSCAHIVSMFRGMLDWS